jgi:CheY-like chemotaxis protein
MSTILLVDDDHGILMAWRRLLRAEGYRVEIADSGEAGLIAADKTRPDLIITDLSMPGMSGMEFCRLLRRDPRFLAIPLILASAEHENLSGTAAWDEVWEKPVAIETMRISISRLLQGMPD